MELLYKFLIAICTQFFLDCIQTTRATGYKLDFFFFFHDELILLNMKSQIKNIVKEKPELHSALVQYANNHEKGRFSLLSCFSLNTLKNINYFFFLLFFYIKYMYNNAEISKEALQAIQE